MISKNSKLNPLFKIALERGIMPAVRLHISRGDDPNSTDARGETPLMIAAKANQAEACSYLLSAGADLSATNSDNKTALDVARASAAEAALAVLIIASNKSATGEPFSVGENKRSSDHDYLRSLEDWEPDAASAPPPDDTPLVNEEKLTQAIISAYHPLDSRSEDIEFDVDLPTISITNSQLVRDSAEIEGLFLLALRDGIVPKHRIEHLCRLDGDISDWRYESHISNTISELGAVIDDAPNSVIANEWFYERTQAEPDALEEAEVETAFQYLNDYSYLTHNTEQRLRNASKLFPLLSADDEQSFGNEISLNRKSIQSRLILAPGILNELLALARAHCDDPKRPTPFTKPVYSQHENSLFESAEAEFETSETDDNDSIDFDEFTPTLDIETKKWLDRVTPLVARREKLKPESSTALTLTKKLIDVTSQVTLRPTTIDHLVKLFDKQVEEIENQLGRVREILAVKCKYPISRLIAKLSETSDFERLHRSIFPDLTWLKKELQESAPWASKMQQHRSELSVAIVTLDRTVKDLGLSIDELHSTRIDLLALTQKGQSIRNRMAMANVLLVFSIANGHQGRGLELDDLVQEGFFGLIKAVERFDHRLGFRFSTYATWWIRQSVTRAIADYARLIRLPVHVIEKCNKFRRLIFELERELGRTPHETEVTNRAQVPFSIVQKYLDFDYLFSSEMPVIDPWNDEASGAFLIEVAQHTLDEEDIFIDQRRRLLRLVVAELPERQAEVIRLRFGLDDGVERTLEQVGAQFGVTRERIRQIEVKALNRLRHPVRVSTISELFDQS